MAGGDHGDVPVAVRPHDLGAIAGQAAENREVGMPVRVIGADADQRH
jgi:hypothetical protein